MWISGVNHLRTHGRRAFAELTGIYEIEPNFETEVAESFNQMIGALAKGGTA